MKKNEGTIDRIIRVIVGVALILGGIFTAGWVSWVLWIVGAISLVTGLIGFCGIYTLFGINTCPVDKKK